MKNEYPVLVSLCIPTYNQTVYLRKTLESVLMQDISDYEIIVTDDSTTDEVRDLLFSYDFGDKLKYFKNEQRKGIQKIGIMQCPMPKGNILRSCSMMTGFRKKTVFLVLLKRLRIILNTALLSQIPMLLIW